MTHNVNLERVQGEDPGDGKVVLEDMKMPMKTYDDGRYFETGGHTFKSALFTLTDKGSYDNDPDPIDAPGGGTLATCFSPEAGSLNRNRPTPTPVSILPVRPP